MVDTLINHQNLIVMFTETTPFEKIYLVSELKALKLIHGNRIIRTHRTKEIAKAYQRGEKLPPITITPSGELLDGQHRLTAYETLTDKERAANPLRVIIDDTSKPPLELAIKYNSKQKPWTTRDYMRAYCLKGNKNYLRVEELRKAFPRLTLSAAIQILKGNRDTEVFYDGKLKVSVQELREAITKCELLIALRPFLGKVVFSRDAIVGMFNNYSNIQNTAAFIAQASVHAHSAPTGTTTKEWDAFYEFLIGLN